MAWEPYFINPRGHRVGTRRRRASRRRRHNPRAVRDPRTGRYRARGHGRYRRNDPLTVLGLNPRRRPRTGGRRHRPMARRRYARNARRVVVVNAPRRRRSRHRARRRPHKHNPQHRMRYYNPRRRRYSRNPRHRYSRNPRRRHYRNPMGARVTLTRPLSWLPYVFTGAVAASASAFAPRLVVGASATMTQAYLVQGAVAAAGLFVLPMIGLRGLHPIAWLVGAGAPIINDLIVKRLLGALGLSYYPYTSLSQSPYYPPRLYGADLYPYEGGTYMFPNAEQERVGAPEAPFEHLYNT